jgi:FixJ family two-component response regulator
MAMIRVTPGHSVLRESLRNGNSAFLQKPFGCQELLQKVRDLLDQ